MTNHMSKCGLAGRVVAVVFCSVLGWAFLFNRTAPDDAVWSPAVAISEDTSKLSVRSAGRSSNDSERTLEASGWTHQAARTVVKQQQEFWRLLDENGPEEVDDILSRLYARLGNSKRWLTAVESQPEYAGLLAASLDVDPQGPDLILDSLEQVPGHEVAIATLYQMGPRPEEVVRTARLLKEEGSLIPRLVERSAPRLIGLLQPEALPHEVEARRIYRRWFRRLAERGLSFSDERLDQIQAILLLHGPTVSARLDDDLAFRRRFIEEIAPLAEAILLKEGQDELEWGVRSGSPGIWEYLQEYGAQGRDWIEAEGAVAIDLLTAPEFRTVRSKVAEAVRFGDQQTIASLLDEDLRNRPLFIKLLERDLPPGTHAKALANLELDRIHAPSLLSYYFGLSDAALIQELGPPPEGPVTWLPGYLIYAAADKAIEGRHVGKLEMAFAALDAFEAIVIVKGASFGLKTVQRAIATEMERKGASVVAEKAARATSRQLLPWVLKRTAAGTREVMERASQSMTVDATKVIRLAFEGSGVGRETFRRFTKLEARVFMRGDRRVLIDFAAVGAKEHVLGRYLRSTAANGGVGEGFGAVVATETGSKAVNASVAQMDAWRKHVAAWWLAHATHSVDRIQATPTVIP